MGKVPSSEHLDHTNAHTFEIEDLKKLIMKTTSDLEAADKKRREEFKVSPVLDINLIKKPFSVSTYKIFQNNLITFQTFIM